MRAPNHTLIIESKESNRIESNRIESNSLIEVLNKVMLVESSCSCWRALRTPSYSCMHSCASINVPVHHHDDLLRVKAFALVH